MKKILHRLLLGTYFLTSSHAFCDSLRDEASQDDVFSGIKALSSPPVTPADYDSPVFYQTRTTSDIYSGTNNPFLDLSAISDPPQNSFFGEEIEVPIQKNPLKRQRDEQSPATTQEASQTKRSCSTPLTEDQKKKAHELLHGRRELTQTAIAREVGCTRNQIANIVRKAYENGTLQKDSAADSKETELTKVQKMKTRELLQERPDLTQLAIAREVGCTNIQVTRIAHTERKKGTIERRYASYHKSPPLTEEKRKQIHKLLHEHPDLTYATVAARTECTTTQVEFIARKERENGVRQSKISPRLTKDQKEQALTLLNTYDDMSLRKIAEAIGCTTYQVKRLAKKASLN